MKENKQPEENTNDQIARKISRFKIIRGLFLAAILGTALLLATACAGSVSPAVGAVPTVTVTPSETPPPVATLAPTATPDTFEDLKVCTDWKNPCPATEEDLMSGRLIDFAKSVGQPFPKEAYNTGRFFFFYGPGGNGYITFTPASAYSEWGGPHPEEKLYRKKGSLIVPYRWQMHFSVPNHDGNTYLISIQQWLNPDNSISYLQYVINAINSENELEQEIPVIVMEKMGMVMPLFGYITPDEISKADNLRGLSYRDDERVQLIYSWGKTGIIPEKLQYKLVTPLVRTYNADLKLP